MVPRKICRYDCKADVFHKRAKIVSEICRTVESLGIVETPVLQGAGGGAEARPVVTYHNSIGRDLYLRIATELHLKLMLVGGFEKVYEIGRYSEMNAFRLAIGID